MGAIVPGPLLGRVIRAGLGGVPLKVFDPLPESVLPFESFPSATESCSLVAYLAAVAPRISELSPWPAASKYNSTKWGRW